MIFLSNHETPNKQLITFSDDVLVIKKLAVIIHYFNNPFVHGSKALNKKYWASCSSCSEEKSPVVPNPDPKQY